MPNSICPECTEEVFVEAECEQGDHVTCDECGSKLTVVGLDPIELDLSEEGSDDPPGTGDDFDAFDDDRY